MINLSEILNEKNPLKRGIQFQSLVQADYVGDSKGGGFHKEKEILYHKHLKRKKGNIGRMDILIDDSDNGYVMIMEIKATIWDNIKPKNIKRNLRNHSNQLYKYIDTYMRDEDYNVGLALIYPEPPKTLGLRKLIEDQAMELYSFPVYWYSELVSDE